MKFFLLLFFSICSFASEPPKENVVTGCRCIECPYYQAGQQAGIWKSKKDVTLYDSTQIKGKPVVQLAAGETTVALTGELHVKPGKLEVIFNHKQFKVGETIYIVNEDAEAGAWKIWHNGKEDFADLSQMVTEKLKCKKPSAECWAKVIEPMSSSWWVQLQTKNKVKGWSKEIESFDFDRSSCM